MLTHPDYFRLTVETLRRQFPTPRLVDTVFRAEVDARAIRERETEAHVQAVRDSLYETTDPRRI